MTAVEAHIADHVFPLEAPSIEDLESTFTDPPIPCQVTPAPPRLVLCGTVDEHDATHEFMFSCGCVTFVCDRTTAWLNAAPWPRLCPGGCGSVFVITYRRLH